MQDSTATFSVTATGAAPLVYRWFMNNGTLLLSLTNSAIEFDSVGLSQSGNRWWVVVSNSFGSVTSTVATLTVLPYLSGPGFDLQGRLIGINADSLALGSLNRRDRAGAICTGIELFQKHWDELTTGMQIDGLRWPAPKDSGGKGFQSRAPIEFADLPADGSFTERMVELNLPGPLNVVSLRGGLPRELIMDRITVEPVTDASAVEVASVRVTKLVHAPGEAGEAGILSRMTPSVWTSRRLPSCAMADSC